MSAPANTRPQPDRELTDIADYVAGFEPSRPALDAARSSLMDTIACALDALDFPECTKLLGLVVRGTVVPHGARVPGTAYELDPAKAAFDFGAMIRWLDLNNPADRDHCAQYVIAVGLIFGRLDARDYEDGVASDPRIDALREKTTIAEDPAYSESFYDPQRRTSANAVQVFFSDGTHTPKIEIEYPAGHPRRRAEFVPTLENKVRSSLARRYVPKRQAEIQALYADPQRLEAIAVNRFVDMLCP